MNAGSTSNLFDHVEMRFGGGGRVATLIADGSPLNVTNSVLKNSSSHAIVARTNATANVSNTLIYRNSDTGVRAESGAVVTVINNSIDSNFRASAADGATTTLTLTNNLITNQTGTGVSRSSAATVSASFNTLFNPNGSNYDGLADQTGQRGNTVQDPKYFNRANAQYQLRAGSPAIDSATSIGSPATDFFGNPRFDDPNVLNLGAGAVPFFDRGAIERQEVSNSDVDLATIAVSGPTSGVQDAVVTVNWTVQNIGVGPAIGSWRDAVYLSVDSVFTPDDQLLGEKLHNGDVGPGQTYSDSASVTLPGALPGDYFFIVRSDGRNEVFEALAKLNNPRASTDRIALDLPALFLGTPLSGQLTATGSAKYYKIAAPAGADLAVNVTGPAGATNELYLKFADIPSRQAFDERGIRANQPAQALSVSSTREGNYFVMVFGANLPSPETFTLTARLTGFSITSVTPTRGSNTGQVTISIAGAQFDGNSQPRLIDSAGGMVQPTRVYFTDSGLISATFDLTGRPTGLANVQVVNTGNVTTTLPGSFNIIVGQPGRLKTSLIAPSRVRLGRDFTTVVEYTNVGDTDLLAPTLQLTTTGPDVIGLTTDYNTMSKVVDVLAIGPMHPAGVLPAGASGRLTLYGRSVSTGVDTIRMVLGTYPTTPIDWVTLGATLKPASMSSAEWVPIQSQLATQIGNQWSSFVAAVSLDATLLPPSMGLNYSVRDVFGLEIQKAIAAINTSVSGRLFLKDAVHPIGDVPVTLTTANPSVAFTTTTLTDGTFLLPQVPAGTYQLTLEGFATGTPVSITVGSSDVNAGNIIVTRGGLISGAVFLNQSGIPAANTAVQVVSGTGEYFTVQTANDGIYTVPGLPAGTYRVSSEGGVFTSAVASNVVVQAGQETRHVNLVVQSAGAIRGTVQGPGGAPLSNVLVVASKGTGPTSSATTDVTGQFYIKGLEAGTYTLVAKLSGFAKSRLDNVVVSTGGTTSGVSLSVVTAGKIRGTLTAQSGGAPIPFGWVALLVNGTVVTGGQADGNGVFDIVDVVPGTYAFTAAGDRFLNGTGTITVAAGQTQTLSPSLAPAGQISGTVTDSVGTPIIGMLVTARRTPEGGSMVITDAKGTYLFDNLSLGDYVIVVGDDPNGVVVGVRRTLTGGAPATVANLTVQLAGRISGRVFATDGTTAVASAEVILFKDNLDVVRTFTESDGRYSLVISMAGIYQIAVGKQSMLFPVRAGLSVAGGGSLTNVDFVAGNLSVQGRLVDSGTSTPIVGAGVLAILSPLSYALGSSTEVTTAADGTFTLAGLAPGDYEILITGATHATVDQRFNLLATGATSVPLNFSTGSGNTLTGTVTDKFGRPLTDAAVLVFRHSDNMHLGTAPTNSQGVYTFNGLPAGTYDLVVDPPGFEQQLLTNVNVSSGSRVLNAALGPSTTSISGTVTSSVGPMANVLVTATDPTGRLSQTVTTTSSGSFIIDTLPPGDYTLNSRPPGGFTGLTPISLPPGGTLTGRDLTIVSVGMPDLRSQPAGPEPIVPPTDNQGWVTRETKIVNIDDIVNLIVPLPQPGCENLRTKALGYLHAAGNTSNGVERAQNAETATLLGLNADVGIVVVNYIDLVAKIVKIPLSIFSALDKLAKASAAADAAYKALKAGQDPAVAVALASLTARLAKAGPTLISLGQFMTITTQKIYKSIRSGQSPNPSDIVSVFSAVNNIGKVMASVATDVELLKGLGHVFNIAGIAFDISSAVLAWQNSGKDYNTSERGIEQRLNATSDARFTDAGARLALFKSVAALKACNAGVKPGTPKPPGSTTVNQQQIDNRTAFDPNDKHGPAGFGPVAFIQRGLMPYNIEFENDPNLGATIPAQEVFVTDTLDADLDLTTVEFTSFGFNKRVFTVPAGLSHYETTIDLRPDGINLLVPVVMNVNPQTRMLSVTFRSLDPLTGLLPDDFDAGFLPVNIKTLHNGEGFFTYTVRPFADRISGTEITNQGSIIFDVNAPILTPTTRNTLDIGTPTSSVSALPSQSDLSLTVNWSGSDDLGGSGIASYTVFVSDNNGPFIAFVTGSTATSAVYTGTNAHTYRFYSVATDNVGQVEPIPATFDAQTLVLGAPWQNSRFLNDVDNDGFMSPLDVLAIVNELNSPQYHTQQNARLVPRTNSNLPFFDVDGDGFVSPLDALIIINAINRGSSGGEGESGVSTIHDDLFADTVWLDDWLGRPGVDSDFRTRSKVRGFSR